MPKGDLTDVVQLLIDTQVFSMEDAEQIQNVHSEVILDMLIERKAVLHDDIEDARNILQDLFSSTNRTRRARAHTALMRLLTGNIHRRMHNAGERFRRQKERFSTGNLPVVALAKLDSNGK